MFGWVARHVGPEAARSSDHVEPAAVPPGKSTAVQASGAAGAPAAIAGALRTLHGHAARLRGRIEHLEAMADAGRALPDLELLDVKGSLAWMDRSFEQVRVAGSGSALPPALEASIAAAVDERDAVRARVVPLVARLEALATPAGREAANEAAVAADLERIEQTIPASDTKLGRRIDVVRARRSSKTDVAARRKELQALLALPTDGAQRAAAREEYEAIEWVAHERGIAVPADPEQQRAPVGAGGVRWWVPSTPEAMRAFIEREVTAAGSFSAGRARAWGLIHSPTVGATEEQKDIGDRQLALIDRDAAAFGDAFEKQNRRVALGMLDESSRVIDGVLTSYGIPGGTHRMSRAARVVADDPDAVEAQVEEWTELANGSGNRAAREGGTGQREDLAKWIHAIEHQRGIVHELTGQQLDASRRQGNRGREEHGRSGRDPLLDRPRYDDGSTPRLTRDWSPRVDPASYDGALAVARRDLKALWGKAEWVHPILAAYRTGDGDGHLTGAPLRPLADDGDVTREVLRRVLPKLGNIYKTRAALEGKSSDLDPLSLGPVVDETGKRMHVPPGSYRAGVVADLVAHARSHKTLVERALDALQLLLSIAQLVPGLGIGARVIANVVDLGINAIGAVNEYAEVDIRRAATDTALDRARSLSDEEPQLTGFIMRLVGAGLNGTEIGLLFKQAQSIRRMALASLTDDAAIAALNAAGEAKGLGRLGDDVAAEARVATSATPASATTRAPEPSGSPFKGIDDAKAVRHRQRTDGEHEYQFNDMNPGPLTDLSATTRKAFNNSPAAGFYGGQYDEIILERETVYYRVCKLEDATMNPPKLGRWYTEAPMRSDMELQMDAAVRTKWTDPETGKVAGYSPPEVSITVRVPAGTKIYKGPVAPQADAFVGGVDKMQVYIPDIRTTPGVELLGVQPFVRDGHVQAVVTP